MSKSRRGESTDYYWLLGATIVLLLFGLIMVFSASSVMAYATKGDSYYFVKRQILGVLVGLLVMGLVTNYDYRRLRRWSLPAVVLAACLLGIVLVPSIGREAGGASRWLMFGPFSFQPSELAKLALIVYAADVLTAKRNKLRELGELLVPVGPVVVLVFFLVLFQPDLGTAFVICFSVYVLMFVSGARWRHLIGLGTAGASAVFLFIFMEGYRLRRLTAFLNPWAEPRGSGFHIIQSLLALGSGGLRGVGLGMSRQKFFYLPAAHTDFVFPIIGEELGLLGTLFVVGLFFILACVGMRIALRNRDFFGKVLGAGITALIVGQAMINMGAVTGLLPITGIPLPLVSFGGSSIIFNLVGIGVLLNMSSAKAARRQLKEVPNESSDLRGRNSRSRLPSPRSSRSNKTSSRRR